MGYFGGWNDWAPRPTVEERKRSAAREIAALRKKGRDVAPVVLEGRTIARTFWGKAWCQNLERYSDYANRLDRGRSYVRSGSVIDLRIAKGKVEALVRGSELYEVTITVKEVESARYQAVVRECAGKIDSVIELLQGKLSGAVMEVITRKETGLFPAPRQIGMTCSCPDYATMCKHVAAVLYGIGARFDHEPELVFRLRGADPTELVSTAAAGAIAGKRAVAEDEALGGDLAGVFGIELDMGPAVKPAAGKQAAVKPVAGKRVGAKPSAVQSSAVQSSAVQSSAAKASAAKASAVKKPPGARGKKATPPPATITGPELSSLGVPAATVQYWLKTGVLGRTDTPGIYLRTKKTEERLMKRLLTPPA